MNSQIVNILFGYDQKLFFEGFSKIISSIPHCKIIASFQNGITLINELKIKKPKILIIEFGNPSKCHSEYLYHIGDNFPLKNTIVISSKISFTTLNEFLKLNLGGIIFKNCDLDDFKNSITKVLNGESFYCSTITQQIFNNYNRKPEAEFNLTHREISVLEFLMEGRTNIYIANQLNISESTVKTHRRNIMSKLSVTNQIELFKAVCKNNHLFHFKSAFCNECPYNYQLN